MVGPSLGDAAMSRVRSRHLERRSGIFGVRVRVPDDIRPLVGRVEVRRSLRTREPLLAQAKSALIAGRLLELFEMIRQDKDQLTQDEIYAKIGQAFVNFVEGFQTQICHSRSSPAPAYASVSVAAGPLLEEAIDAFLLKRSRSWTAKTYASRVRRLDYLKQYLGPTTPLVSISANDIRGFRDSIARLRANKGTRRLEAFASRQTDNREFQIDPKTASLIYEPTKAFFRWCKAEQGYLAVNPAEDVRMSLPKKAKGKKSRRPFTDEEVIQLFTSPLFVGCASKSRRFEQGQSIVKDAKYWLPVLGYYTGARLGELVQLHIGDVDFSGQFPFLHITEEHAGRNGTSDAKHVKSEAGVRQVPLHPDLLEMGFQAFVEARSRLKRPTKRLFYEVAFGSDGQASTVFSKFFGRLLDKVGLPDPALVFHSFRHGAEDAFRNALQPQYVIDRILGHSDGATSARYGDGVSLEVTHKAVVAMMLKVSLPRLWETPRGT